MTKIPRLSSNTEKDPPKFLHELDSFAEERSPEKISGWCGADTLVRELRRCSRSLGMCSRPPARTRASVLRRRRALAHYRLVPRPRDCYCCRPKLAGGEPGVPARLSTSKLGSTAVTI